MSKKGPEPYFLNIAPLLPGHEEELASDIADLAACGAITCSAFICTLTPEGDPVFDKASVLGKRFAAHYAALRKKSDIPCGILIQATIGHGWTPNVPSAGQKFVPGNGPGRYIFCPLGKEFRAYIEDQVGKLAAAGPDFFMLDDDFRMLTGRGGCFCPLHTAGFNALAGKDRTPDELRKAVEEDEKTARAYDAWLQETMADTAKIIRRAIDSRRPGLPCSFCMCGEDVRHAPELARILQGRGALRIRINNGFYMADSPRALPAQMLRSARQALHLPADAGILDEPDTCPQNRYSTGAAVLHDHLARAMLAGYAGAKIWITRINAFEPASGRAYRRIMKEYAGFYRALFALEFAEDGILVPLPEKPPFNFPLTQKRAYPTGNWLTQTAVMGFPFRLDLSSCAPKVSAVSGDDCDQLTDADIKNLFTGDLILDGSAALKLTLRGFAEALGVTASPWGELPAPSFEAKEDGSSFIALSRAAGAVRLEMAPGIAGKVLTWISHRTSAVSDDSRIVAPGSVSLTRPDGKRLFVMAASLKDFDFTAFSYLNETRKAQFAQAWQERIAVYYDGDAELMIRTGISGNGRRIVILHAISAEGVDRPRLVFRETAESLERLSPDGIWRPLPFTREGVAVIPELEARPFFPEVLRVASVRKSVPQ
ncbi:MAG: hypothetical protein IJU70_02810 [Lentisphaeria bacterium]|nr:hypothetical protein [Lentisphaeria bacterium]